MNIPYVMKRCSKCGKWKVASTINFYRDKNGKYELRAKCKECTKKYSKQYRKNNKDKIAEYSKQYYQDNRDKKLEYNKHWNKDNRDKMNKYNNQWRQTPTGQASRFNLHNKRRHKKEAQGTGATGDQWLEMMKYFDWKCAYSGERLSNKTRSVDHIVPIDAGGDDMVWNMVPMTRSLNSSKCAKDMLEWYKEQDCYSEARLAKIYEWQEYARKKWQK